MKTKVTLLCQFVAGFLSVFGLSNPAKDNIKISNQSRDVEKLYGDWSKVGNDINKSYEQFKSECLK